jgi:hypothetical protein
MNAPRGLLFPLPVYGERVASAGRREPGEGQTRHSDWRKRPLTRFACAMLRRTDLSSPAGRGENRGLPCSATAVISFAGCWTTASN